MVTENAVWYLTSHLLLADEVIEGLIATVDRHEIEQDDYTVVLDGVDLRKRLQEALDAVTSARALL